MLAWQETPSPVTWPGVRRCTSLTGVDRHPRPARRRSPPGARSRPASSPAACASACSAVAPARISSSAARPVGDLRVGLRGDRAHPGLAPTARSGRPRTSATARRRRARRSPGRGRRSSRSSRATLIVGTLAAMTRIAILGPGGVGGFLAAALDPRRRERRWSWRARRPRATSSENGIAVESVRLGDFTARPAAVPRLDRAGRRADRGHQGGRAARRARADRGAAGAGRAAAQRPRAHAGAPGALRRRGRRGDPDRGRPARGRAGRPDEPGRCASTWPPTNPIAGRRGRAPGHRARGRRHPADRARERGQVLWRSWCGCARWPARRAPPTPRSASSAADPRWRSALEGAINEAAAVAKAEGAGGRPGGPAGRARGGAAELGSSMQRDIAAGRAPELDAIAGAVLRAGARHGLRCPTIAWLAGRVAERAGIAAPLLGPTAAG